MADDKKRAGVNGPFPALQVALDFLDLERAIALAGEAVEGGADWLEAGTPLIKSDGLEAVRRLRAAFPGKVIVADLKTMDGGKIEFEAASKAGADVAVVLAAAADATIIQCVETGRRFGMKVYCDTIGLADPAARAKEVEAMGVDFIGVHLPVDEQMSGKSPLDKLRAVRAAVNTPLAVAGGVTSETAPAMVEAGASVVIVGGALHKAPDARKAAADIRRAMDTGTAVASAFGRRSGAENLRDTLLKVSVSNLSDAMHRRPGLRGMTSRTPGMRMAGRAVTVRTIPGDWSHVVRAIDKAQPGDVIVADCGGIPPAVWGELATLSAKGRGLAGAAIWGAVRDTDVSTKIGFPLFSAQVSPDAGDPKGFGEFGTEIQVAGQLVRPGDWIVGDDDGVLVLPSEKSVEYANRAMDVLEAENRLRAEILSGKTLAQVARLDKWEKR